MRTFILVVERDLQTRETIIDMCSALGHVGLGATTPTRGLKMLEMMVFQAILISPGATLLGEPSYAVEAKKNPEGRAGNYGRCSRATRVLRNSNRRLYSKTLSTYLAEAYVGENIDQRRNF